jgi:hypothetical protein
MCVSFLAATFTANMFRSDEYLCDRYDMLAKLCCAHRIKSECYVLACAVLWRFSDGSDESR